MKTAIIAAAAALLLATPALAQKVRNTNTATSGSVSYGQNSLTYAPTSTYKDRVQVPGASSTFGATMQSSFGCENVGGIGVPYLSLSVPMESRTACPIAAMMAFEQCDQKRGRSRSICMGILAQNPYARPMLVQFGEVIEGDPQQVRNYRPIRAKN